MTATNIYPAYLDLATHKKLAAVPFYTKLADAKNQLAARAPLKTAVEQWWQSRGWSPILPDQPNLAVLARQIATYRYEDGVFHFMAKAGGLNPACLELTSDKMSEQSSYKRSLLHPVFFERFGRNGGMVTQKHKLAGIRRWHGLPLDKIILENGTSLLDYHHQRYDQVFGSESRADNSTWASKIGGAEQYYPAFLSLFVAHAVLFEDYHDFESETEVQSLTTEIVQPTFRKLTAQFGVQPLIVPLPRLTELSLYPPDKDWIKDNVISLDSLTYL